MKCIVPVPLSENLKCPNPMPAQHNIDKAEKYVPAQEICSQCLISRLQVCSSNSLTAQSVDLSRDLPQWASFSSATRVISWEQDVSKVTPVICDGWAATYVILPTGVRQILSFILPGEPISSAQIFAPLKEIQIEAITNVRYRMFDRARLIQVIYGASSGIGCISTAWLQEKRRSDQMIVALGRQTKEVRIAGLIYGLVVRLRSRGLAASDRDIPFPLRRHHIADATGLTIPTVSKVLADFREKGVFTIEDRRLSILAIDRFERFATSRSHF